MGRYTEPDRENCALIAIDVQRDPALAGAHFETAGIMEAKQL